MEINHERIFQEPYIPSAVDTGPLTFKNEFLVKPMKRVQPEVWKN